MFLAVVLAMALVLGTADPAQDGDRLGGQRVVPTARTLTLRVNDEPVEADAHVFHVYRVEQADGPSLLLKAEDGRIRGWVDASLVVPVEKAVDFYTGQIRARARDAFSRAMRGFIHFDRHELDLALGDYNEAINLDRQDPAILCARGSAWLAKKEYAKAIADFDEAVRLDPRSAAAYMARGTTHEARGALTLAIADFSEAIWLDPLAVPAYFHRGSAWLAKKEWAKAVVDYNVVVRLDPAYAPAHVKRGAAWEADGKYERALADYRQAIRIDPSSAEGHRAAARLLASCPESRFRDGRKAVESATRACELTAWKDPVSLDVLAAATASAGDFDSAARWQTRAIELDSDSAASAERRARLKHYRSMAASHQSR